MRRNLGKDPTVCRVSPICGVITTIGVDSSDSVLGPCDRLLFPALGFAGRRHARYYCIQKKAGTDIGFELPLTTVARTLGPLFTVNTSSWYRSTWRWSCQNVRAPFHTPDPSALSCWVPSLQHLYRLRPLHLFRLTYCLDLALNDTWIFHGSISFCCLYLIWHRFLMILCSTPTYVAADSRNHSVDWILEGSKMPSSSRKAARRVSRTT